MKKAMKINLESFTLGALRVEMVLVLGVVGLCAAKAGALLLI